MLLTLCRAFLSKPTPRRCPAIHSLKQWVGGKPENDALERSGRFCFSTFCRVNGEGGSSLPRGENWLPVTQTLGKITNMRQHADPTARMSQGRTWETRNRLLLCDYTKGGVHALSQDQYILLRPSCGVFASVVDILFE